MPGDHDERKHAKPTLRRRVKQRIRVDRTSVEGRGFPRGRSATQTARADAGHGNAHTLNETRLKRLTKHELLTLARRESLHGRSKMNKAQLARTLRKHFRHAA